MSIRPNTNKADENMAAVAMGKEDRNMEHCDKMI